MLKKLKEFFTVDTEQKRIERYLSKSVDIYDLEARMKSIQEKEKRDRAMFEYN